jgi:ABC-2 type transport system ATP-binding protein
LHNILNIIQGIFLHKITGYATNRHRYPFQLTHYLGLSTQGWRKGISFKERLGVFMDAIVVKDLSKTFRVKVKEKGLRGSIKSIFRPTYRTIKAVDDISFRVAEGEILAFIGPNGAGKSTTIKMLTGILYPDQGGAFVMDLNPSLKRKQLSYQIGTVFGQKEQLWTHLTPYDNFKFFGAIYDMKDSDAEARIDELKAVFELEDFINTPVRNLSLGQRIRCEIAASLIHRPKILFLDEPTIGLDPVVKENIRTLIKKMNKEFKTTVFLTSHDVGDIEKLCKRIIIVNHGQIVLDDSMEHLKYHYLNKKIVEVKTREMMDLSDEDGITVLKSKGNHLKLEIETTKKNISDALKLIDSDNILDINISNVPLENIITEIYKENRQRA